MKCSILDGRDLYVLDTIARLLYLGDSLLYYIVYAVATGESVESLREIIILFKFL
ncbi:hypothetical protein HRbin02_00958 [Candidatus Calditenuaceae archaeon HR02]|nr:hypothetical protein HRbin02_00958 [Candidatus Calditenuaceae archaeon HR02]